MFKKTLSLFTLAMLMSFDTSVLAAKGRKTDAEKRAMGLIYVFDQNAEGQKCDNTLKNNNEEDFRLYCINSQASFRKCAMTCTELLHFEGSKSLCKSHRCDFYGQVFSTDDEGPLAMHKIAQGKVTFFTLLPLWEGHAQYMYELLEELRATSEFEDQTEAIVLPIDIHNYELNHPRFEIAPFQSELGDLTRPRQVHILSEVKPQEIGRHQFLTFLRSLVHREGFPNFDVYTDRPVVFAISHDGYQVERMVVPTLDDLKDAARRLGPNSRTATTQTS